MHYDLQFGKNYFINVKESWKPQVDGLVFSDSKIEFQDVLDLCFPKIVKRFFLTNLFRWAYNFEPNLGTSVV